jgi:hypothetical protein
MDVETTAEAILVRIKSEIIILLDPPFSKEEESGIFYKL